MALTFLQASGYNPVAVVSQNPFDGAAIIWVNFGRIFDFPKLETLQTQGKETG